MNDRRSDDRKPKKINLIDPKTIWTPTQKAAYDAATIRQRLEQQFPRLRRSPYVRDDEDPLADNVAPSDDDQLARAIDELCVKENELEK